jgi:hypothetical protein
LRPDQIFEKLGEQGGFGVVNIVSLFVQIPGLRVISAHQLETQSYDQCFDGVRAVMVV